MLTIVRGLPGSGKSTVANALASRVTSRVAYVFEADDYFMRSGTYKFDPSRLKEAHAECQANTRKALEQGAYVFVANTFTQRWEYQPYLDMAAELGVKVQVIEVHGDFGSIHNVPDEAMARMRARWEPHKEMDSEWTECADCGDSVRKAKAHIATGGDILCGECAEGRV